MYDDGSRKCPPKCAAHIERHKSFQRLVANSPVLFDRSAGDVPTKPNRLLQNKNCSVSNGHVRRRLKALSLGTIDVGGFRWRKRERGALLADAVGRRSSAQPGLRLLAGEGKGAARLRRLRPEGDLVGLVSAAGGSSYVRSIRIAGKMMTAAQTSAVGVSRNPRCTRGNMMTVPIASPRPVYGILV